MISKKYKMDRFLKQGAFLLLLLGASSVIAQENIKSTDTIASGIQGSINPLTDNTAVLTGIELLDESFPNSIPLFGSDVRMKIGGYVKADFIHDLDYVGDRYEFELGSIAVEGSPERELGGITTFHVKQTRLNFDFRSKAKWKNGKEFPMQVFLEMDWFFDSDDLKLVPRMRHAYGVIGRLLIGRTWTNSGDLATLPGTIDFSGGDALYGGRVSQIRWQDSFGKNFTYAIALEEAGGQIDNPNALDGAFRAQYPNLAGNVKYKTENGSSFQLGFDLFTLNWKGSTTTPNVTETGYAITGTGRFAFKLSHYKDAFMYGAGYGKGQAHRIIALSWDGKASGVITENGLDLSPSWFAYAGFNHYWSKSLNSTVSTAWAGTELSEDQLDNTIQKAGSVHANLIWFPYPRISTGIEYMWGVRENKNGIEGTANRIQFMAKYKFN
ncbi:DcaP family trimeric outer membrane transporter [Hanstruepera marina]|uniref:DcaP family trimeric outer membrane transporter n=1 Tax=Hanstruepera marina TaxID=2873265 RepID=UPI001CA7B66C|nr:DcaP family trimeric outer membrane transporter [Hanstruepera marina]